MSDANTRPDPLQELIGRWETLHPYNFVDSVELSEAVDPSRLRASLAETLQELSLAHSRIPDALESVAEELARPFTEQEAPVRIGWKRSTEVAFTFRHRFFDGVTAALVVERALGRSHGLSYEPLRLARASEGISIRHLPRSILDLIRMRRVDARAQTTETSPKNAVYQAQTNDDLLERLQQEARLHRATVNDVLTTRLARAIRQVSPHGIGRRSRMSIAIAVNMRKRSEPMTPGVKVGWFPVFTDEHGSVESIRDQTRREKQTRSWARSRTEMRLASLIWPHIAAEQRGRYFGRQYVISAGLTNFMVPTIAGVERYRRAVATGPIAPLVVSVLTFKSNVSISLTWPEGLFRAEEIETIAGTLT